MAATSLLEGISDADLVGRAVRNARDPAARKSDKHPRWVHVMHTFSLGSGYSQSLCRSFNLNPDEKV